MFLSPLIDDVQILSVLHLSWNTHQATARPRPFHALSFWRSGNAQFKADTDTLQVKTGEVLYVPENLGYQLEAEQEDLFVIHFKMSAKQEKLEAFVPLHTTLMDELFSSCYKVWRQKKPGYYFRTLSLFYSILEQLMLCSMDDTVSAKQRKLQPALDYIRAHFTNRELTIKQLADIAFMSETYFRTVFAQVMGEVPTKYINRLRISYAKDLIETGLYKIETVAEMAGFSDSKYFSTVFRQYTGFSPRHYKKHG